MSRSLAVVVGVGLACASGASFAEEPAPPAAALTVVGCVGIDQARLRDALALELTAQPPSEWLSNLALRLTCNGPRASIEIRGRGDRARVHEVPLPAAGAGRERTLALAISEAVLAADGERREAAAPAIAPAIADPPAIVRASAAPPAPARDVELGVAAAARARSLGSTFPTFGVAVVSSLAIGASPWRAVLELGGEQGGSDAEGGRVRAQNAYAGVGLERRWGVAARLRPAFAVGVLAAAGMARVSGAPASAAVRGDDVSGASALVRVGGGPTWAWGPARAALDVQAGWSPANPIGRIVSAGAAASERSLGGAWVGAALRLSVGGL